MCIHLALGSKTFMLTKLSQAVRLSSTKPRTTHDYVIVGAGSAGCVLANRLSAPGSSAQSASRVHLLEAGPTDKGLTRWTIHMPAALMYNLYHDKYNWYYHTVPQKFMNNRVMYWPRGRVLGGSSSLNAMVYIRGHAFDYDRWEKEGATGWNYANCLPYFRRAQTHELGPDEYRGSDGPLYVSRGKTNHPLHRAWLEAGQQAGYDYTDDVNGYQQEGVGYFDMTIKNGKRCSTAVAYLHPIRQTRPNLKVTERALVTRILFEKNKAIGVEYEKNGLLHEALAEREVILCGGAINSPQLLLLSGIGNVDHLRQVGVDGWHHLPGVGQNLQDHLEVYVQHSCKKPVTLYKAQWKFPHHMIAIGLRYFLFHTGWGATSHLETGGFARSEPSVSHPDIQFHFLPSTIHDHGRKMGTEHAYQVHVGPMRPTSRGQLLLASGSPRDAPVIDANYMATPRDRQEMRASIRLSREIFAQPALAKEFGGRELAPGAEKTSDTDLDAFVRACGDSAYHPSCTCRMGSNPDGKKVDPEEARQMGYVPTNIIEAAVTKPDCKVWGLEGLRIVDASIMPSVVSGNLNAPVIMMAERAADLILSERDGKSRMLPPDTKVKVWKPKHPELQRDGTPVVKHIDKL